MVTQSSPLTYYARLVQENNTESVETQPVQGSVSLLESETPDSTFKYIVIGAVACVAKRASG